MSNYLEQVLSRRQQMTVAWALPLLLAALYAIKHYLSFSLTNFTFFLLLPVGPFLIGMALASMLTKERTVFLSARWLALLFTLAVCVFFLDQFFAYLHDGGNIGFLNWYADIVQNRSWMMKVRGSAPIDVARVGEGGFLLELIKLGAIVYPGFGMYRNERELLAAEALKASARASFK